MSHVSRRGSFAAMSTFALAVGSGPLLAAPPVTIPAGPMRLSRLISRSLFDGSTVDVAREWRVAFTRQGRGSAVSGTQVSVQVEAPERISAIAKLEEARSTAEMWPILISPEGRILAAGRDTDGADLDAAIATARSLIAKAQGGNSGIENYTRQLSQMQAASTSLLDQLPSDLFFPVGETSRISRQIELPDGKLGEFAVTYISSKSSTGGWLAHAERQVTTRIGNDKRTSFEKWTMSGF